MKHWGKVIIISCMLGILAHAHAQPTPEACASSSEPQKYSSFANESGQLINLSLFAENDYYHICAGKLPHADKSFVIEHKLDKPLLIDNLQLEINTDVETALIIKSPVILRNAQITHTGSDGGNAGIHIESNQVEIHDAQMSGFTQGIVVLGNDNLIQGSVIQGMEFDISGDRWPSAVGVQLDGENNQSLNNTITQHRTALQAVAHDGLKVLGDTLKHTDLALHILSGDSAADMQVAPVHFSKVEKLIESSEALPAALMNGTQLFVHYADEAKTQIDYLLAEVPVEFCGTEEVAAADLQIYIRENNSDSDPLLHWGSCAITAQVSNSCKYHCQNTGNQTVDLNQNTLASVTATYQDAMKVIFRDVKLGEKPTPLATPLSILPSDTLSMTGDAPHILVAQPEPSSATSDITTDGLNAQTLRNEEEQATNSAASATETNALIVNTSSKNSPPLLGGCSLIIAPQ